MPKDYFGEDIAATYDDDEVMFARAVVEPAVDFLADLTGSKKALEFGIGTGRIALPLAARGVEVWGIDLSTAMLERLAAKHGAERIRTSVGSFSDTDVEETFGLVYLVFNTIMNLTSQRDQVACFANAARHLQPGGAFVIEVLIPRLQQLPFGETIQAFDLTESHWGIDEYDITTQMLVSHHLRKVDGQLVKNSLPCRYVWPAELDLMAQMAGLKLDQRWEDWDRSRFTRTSSKHVSVWVKPG